MEACVGALARWCDTYLLPEDGLPAPLEAAYGKPSSPAAPVPPASNGAAGNGHASSGGGGALAVLDMTVQVAVTCLTSYAGEAELHKKVCAFVISLRSFALMR
jgi:hypothetical protein